MYKYCNLMQITRKLTCIDLSQILKNFILGQFRGSFDRKISKQYFSQKRSIKSILSLHATVTQKNQKNSRCRFFIKLEKYFEIILVRLNPKISKQDVSQKIIWVSFKPLYCCNFLKNQENHTHRDF